MEQKQETKLSFNDNLNNFYSIHKIKVFSLSFIFILIIIAMVFILKQNRKKNILISEKFVQAGLNLSLNKKEEAKKLFNEIILSKNKFYSILALNNIIEKELENNDRKILEYFEMLESLNFNKEQLDLLIFKSLLKTSRNLEGKELLKKLIEKNSKLKILAEQTIAN